MEIYDTSKLNSQVYTSVFKQVGNGSVSMDRYVYDQSGEGIGAVLGNLLKIAVPLVGPLISGIKSIIQKKPKHKFKSLADKVVNSKEFSNFASDAASYIKPVAKKAIKAGVKRAYNHISDNNHKHVIGGVAKKHTNYRKRLAR